MRIIGKDILDEYGKRHTDAKGQLEAWCEHAKRSNWMNPLDIKAECPKASIIPNNRVVFNIRGNDYRLVVTINYKVGIINIRWVGTHLDYDKINAARI
jgi:mRNA interferase HigB